MGGFFEAVRRFWNLGFHAVCEEYGTENVPIHELRDFYGHIFRGSCAKWARMWRLWERFAFVDRFGHYFNDFLRFFRRALQKRRIRTRLAQQPRRCARKNRPGFVWPHIYVKYGVGF